MSSNSDCYALLSETFRIYGLVYSVGGGAVATVTFSTWVLNLGIHFESLCLIV
jgi:hypothetical protein